MAHIPSIIQNCRDLFCPLWVLFVSILPMTFRVSRHYGNHMVSINWECKICVNRSRGSTWAVNITEPIQTKMVSIFMMTSSNGNIFRVTGPLCGEFTGPRWIPRTKASDAELWCFLWSAPWINGWVNKGEVGDLRRYRAHYDVIVMFMEYIVSTREICIVMQTEFSHPIFNIKR